MPSVPQYGQPQVQEQALPNVRVGVDAPAEAFGGGASRISDAAGGFAKQVHDIAVQEKQKADEVAVTEAYNQTLRKKNELVYDPQKGAMTRRGKDAFGVAEEYGGEFDKFADGVAESLANPEQRAFYDKMRGRVRMDLDDTLGRHTFQEGQKFEEATFESSISTLEEDAILNYQQPGKLAENVALQRAQIESFGAKRGMPADWIKTKANEVNAKTYASVINRMLANGQDYDAKNFYTSVKDTVPFGALTDDIEKSLRMGSIKGESQRQADAIMSKFGGDMPSAMAEAAKEKDPEIREALEERVSRLFNIKKIAKADKAEALYLRGANLIDTNREAIKTGKMPMDLMTPDEWKQLPLNERNSLNNYAAAIADGRNIVSDMKLYQDLMIMASTPATRDKFMRTYIPVDKFAPTEYKELVKYQAQLRTGDEKVVQKLDGIRSKNSARDDAFEKVIGPVSDKRFKQLAAEFAEVVDAEIESRQKITGKEVTNQEVTEIANAQLVKVVTERNKLWYDTKVYRFKAPPGSNIEFDYEDIPEDDKQKARSALQRLGNANPTESDIVDAYIKKLKGPVRAN